MTIPPKNITSDLMNDLERKYLIRLVSSDRPMDAFAQELWLNMQKAYEEIVLLRDYIEDKNGDQILEKPNKTVTRSSFIADQVASMIREIVELSERNDALSNQIVVLEKELSVSRAVNALHDLNRDAGSAYGSACKGLGSAASRR